MLVVLFLAVLSSLGAESLRVISTDPSVSLARDEGVAVVLHSSLQHLEELTVCFRFKTFNYDVSKRSGNRGVQSLISINDFSLLNSFVGVQCGEWEGCEEFYKSFIPNWKRGKAYGRTTNNMKNMFPGWLPLQWRSVCMSGSSLTSSWNITLDGRQPASYQYDGYHRGCPGNIVLMNINHEARRLEVIYRNNIKS